MVLSRVADNLLAVGIIVGIGWMIYANMQGNNAFNNLKEKIGRFTKGGNNNGRFRRN